MESVITIDLRLFQSNLVILYLIKFVYIQTDLKYIHFLYIAFLFYVLVCGNGLLY